MTNNNFDTSGDEMEIDNTIYAGESMPTLECISPYVFQTSNLVDAIKYILNNNKNKENNETLTEKQAEIFQIVEKLYTQPQTMFANLRKKFAKYFDIDLYPIVFDNGNYSLITKNNYGEENKAFLLFKKDNTVDGPLFIKNGNGTIATVFSANDPFELFVTIYVSLLNEKVPSYDYPLEQEQEQEQLGASCSQESTGNSSVRTTSSSNNELIHDNPTQSDEKIRSDILLGTTCYHICRLFNKLPIQPNTINQAVEPFLYHIAAVEQLTPKESIMALEDITTRLSHLIQTVKPSIFNDQNNSSGNAESSTLLNEVNTQNIESNSTNLDAHNPLQNEMDPTSPDVSTPDQSLDVSETYGKPTITKLLQSTIHPRTLKEFAETGSAPLRCVNSKQGDPLHIEVPPDDGIPLHLFMEIVTHDKKAHPSKFLVPDGTKLKGEAFIDTNDLRMLNFGECDQGYTFNKDTKQLYAEISSQEREAKQKDVRIHLLNLYQRGSITRKMVNEKGLKKFRLALWLCICENKTFSCVSEKYYSDVIEESTKPTN
ncbi:unnamed protein product [Adineta steineri]|uniref:Uncharacterized protein n=1 Tax=Adineta steineri TaxID=433720 RepID=A0A813VJI5_9BILA|nr:unnamed protein product [Adineta steineri]CAF4152082.1 unnamed protein product [Adineta steineri]